MSLIGMREFQDVLISVDFLLPTSAPNNVSACVGTRAEQMWVEAIVLCVSSEQIWTLSIGGPQLGAGYDDGNIIATGTSPMAVGKAQWHTLALTTVGKEATGTLDGTPLWDGSQPIRDIDSGFAVIGTNQWQPVEYDNFLLQPAGGDAFWASSTTSDDSSTSFARAGSEIGVTECERNGVVDDTQAFDLIASWQLRHVATGLCVQAEDASSDAVLTLQDCVHGSTTQQFRNDYTRIRNTESEVTLGAYGVLDDALTLIGRTDGSVTLGSGDADDADDDSWEAWSYFPNTKQLRNQYTAIVELGYPMCLAVLP
jgi:hypothetical protein